jgi:Ni,Fe-hydrogenase I large subunit
MAAMGGSGCDAAHVIESVWALDDAADVSVLMTALAAR